MMNNNNNFISINSKNCFSDGSSFYRFFRYNITKIYDVIFNEENGKYYLEKYPICCEKIKNQFYRKKLTFEEKLEEYLDAMLENNYNIIKTTSNKLFSDNTSMDYFWNANKTKIYETITNEKKCKYYLENYRICCDVIKTRFISKVLTFEEKLQEYFEAMQDNDYEIIKRTSTQLFSDGTSMNHFWNANKTKIYKTITNERTCKYYLENYKECCISILNKYNLKEFLFEKRLIEFLEKLIYNDDYFKTKDKSCFDDGTQICFFWDTYKFKIFNVINSENKNNEYYENYRYSCDRINIEIYRNLIKHRKYEEAKEIFNDESEYENLLNKYNIKIKK